MAQKYQKGEYVCYGMNGVCLIEDVREIAVSGNRDTFYVLRPLRDRHSTFYIPFGNEALLGKMRDLITREEIHDMIDSVRLDTLDWIEDRKERMEVFRELLRRSDPQELMRLSVLLNKKKQSLAEAGKKLSPSDESILKQAEDLTENEFGFVLEMPTDDVRTYIMERL